MASNPQAGHDGGARGLTRRRMLTGAGAAVGLLAAGGGAGYATGHAAAEDVGTAAESADTVAFHGPHQSGVATPAQQRLVFAAFDFSGERAADLQALLRTWTDAAARMTAGQSVAPDSGISEVPPTDTGEAVGLPPSRLTVTFGLAPELFERDGEDRLGLRARRPSLLRPLGALPGDQLDASRTGGDLCVQACADDPQVAFHAVRNLLRVGRGLVELRWLQLGFGSNTRTTRTGATPRNLMGFKDGTRNLDVRDAAQMAAHVWVDAKEGQGWMQGGTYVVARRIRMLIEAWDRDALADQEATIGRVKGSGAPLGQAREFDVPDLAAKGPDGAPLIPAAAHIRLAAPESNGGVRILRRGYAYTDGIDPRTGLLDAGLFFIAFQRDPQAGFVAIQRRLGADALQEYIQHTGGGLFAVPPGARRGGYVGESLFSST